MGFPELPQDSQSGPGRESTSLLCSLAWRDRSEPPGNQFIVFHKEGRERAVLQSLGTERKGQFWALSPLLPCYSRDAICNDFKLSLNFPS